MALSFSVELVVALSDLTQRVFGARGSSPRGLRKPPWLTLLATGLFRIVVALSLAVELVVALSDLT